MTRPGAPSAWAEISAASLPAERLACLGPVRASAEVRVRIDGSRAWVHWPAGRPEVVRCLHPVPGVVFFTRRNDHWHRFGRKLPTSDGPPDGEYRPLASVLTPARVAVVEAEVASIAPVELRFVRGGEPRPVTALMGSLSSLETWAASATTMELARVNAALCGERVILLGETLPPIPGATRFWGSSVLVPVGHRPDPDLPPEAIRASVGARKDEIVMLHADGVELLPRGMFEPLTRAGVKLALLGAWGEAP